ncbi:efflux RND transporter periplasmic adaptor subunit [Devosia sp. A16]|uniref:efflux RND transporter periplasmic adaptor subunit n=1 Tax=Devosia sp. A16 TaxID=1736675 RepID=UPI0006D7EE82|nr:efflux RND transporter periplasmic adaptor subunit [Devosia sp. A16]
MLQKADVAEVLRAEAKRGRHGTLLRLAIGAGVILVIAAGVAVLFSRLGSGSTAYETTTVSRGDILVELTATGTLVPTRQVAVSSSLTGTIASVDVDYNQPVRKGQLLARLDLRPFDLQVRRAVATVDIQQAARDTARAGLSDAEAAWRRTSDLAAGKVVSTESLELATTALQRARASLAAAQAQLKAAEADLAGARDNYDKANIVAPIDGIMLDVNAEVGETINAATLASSLFLIASDIRRLELEADIDEADVAQIKVGDAASFTVEAMPDRPFGGVVRQLRTGPTVSNGITSYKAVIAVDNAGLQLRPGMTATANISTAEAKGVLTVPNAALRFAPDEASAAAASNDRASRVYVLRAGAPVALAVTSGLTDGQRTEIKPGSLVEQDLVVVGKKTR